jgi:hypothetical protein
MATKTNYLLGLLDGAIAQIDNRATQNQALATIREIRDQVSARKLLGEDPDESKLENSYSAIAAAIQSCNQITVTIPSQEEVVDGLAGSQTEEEAEAAAAEEADRLAAVAKVETVNEVLELVGDTEE